MHKTIPDLWKNKCPSKTFYPSKISSTKCSTLLFAYFHILTQQARNSHLIWNFAWKLVIWKHLVKKYCLLILASIHKKYHLSLRVKLNEENMRNKCRSTGCGEFFWWEMSYNDSPKMAKFLWDSYVTQSWNTH